MISLHEGLKGVVLAESLDRSLASMYDKQCPNPSGEVAYICFLTDLFLGFRVPSSLLRKELSNLLSSESLSYSPT